MSTIDINAEWRVTSDVRQWTLERLHTPKEKEDGSQRESEFKALNFHPSIQSALNWYVERAARTSDAENIEALRGVVKKSLLETLDALERYQKDNA